MQKTVKMLNGALHYSTRSKRGSDIGFSSCTALKYLILVSENFGCILGTPRILEVSGEDWEFRSNLELEHHPERGEHRG